MDYTASGVPVGMILNAQGQPVSTTAPQNTSSNQTYVPPDTSAPVSGNQVVNGSPLNYPQGTPPDNGSSLVNSAMTGVAQSLPPPTTAPTTPNLDLATTGDYTKEPGYQQAQGNLTQAQNSLMATENALPSQANLLSQAQQSTGAATDLAAVSSLKTQLAQAQAAYNNQYQNIGAQGVQQGTSALFYQGEQAAQQRQAAVLTAGLATQLQAAQGNYDAAEALAEKTANLQFQDAQNKINNLKDFVTINQNNLTQAEKVATSKMQAQATLLQQQLDQQKTLRTLALQTGVSKPFMNIGGTVYSTATGQAFSSPEQAAQAGVDIKKWSNVQTVDPTQASQKFTQVGMDNFGNPVYGFVNETKGTVTPIAPSTGTYQSTGDSLASSTPNPSKVIGGYDFTTYASDPNWGNAVQNIMAKIPDLPTKAGPNAPDSLVPEAQASILQDYIKQVAPSSKITGQMIVTAAQQYGVNPKILTAIMQQESQFGTAGMGAKTFNPGNVGNTDSGATKNYGDWQSGINAAASNMAQRVTSGLATSAQTGLDFSQYGLLANTNFTPTNTVDQLAQRYLDLYIKSGQVPTATALGRNIKPQGMAQVDSRARDLFHQATGTALPSPAIIKGYQTIINNNNQMANNLKIQEQTVAANVDLSVQNLKSNDLNSSGFRPLDNLLNSISNAFQDPKVGQLLAQNVTLQNEMGSLLAIKNASGTTVYDKMESAGLISSSDSPQVIEQKVKTLMQEAGNFADSISSANASAYKVIDPFLQDPNNPIISLSQQKGFDLQRALKDGHKYDEIMQALTQS